MTRFLMGSAILLAASATALSAAAQSTPSLTLYDRTEFRGHAFKVQRNFTDLSGEEFNDITQSMKAEGRWEVCLDANYRGGCRVIQGEVSDMGDWREKVTSVRYLGPADWGTAPAAGSAPVTGGAAQAAPVAARYVLDYEPDEIGNVYDTDFGEMTLEHWDRAGAKGRYNGGDATAGWFEGSREIGDSGPDGIDVITGYWHQKTAATRCSTEKGGTYYWGTMRFHFVRDRSSFLGFWGTCEGTTLDRWNGEFARRDEKIVAEVEAQKASQQSAQSGAVAVAAPGGASGTPAGQPTAAAKTKAKGKPLPPPVDRTIKAGEDEVERRVQDKLRDAIGKVF